MAVASTSAPMDAIGYRIVRGPDWKWGKQDGGEGHVGTVRSFENPEEVLVLWDNGTAANYRFTSSSDLRVLDSGPAGVCHNTSCNGCNCSPIFGIRWNCLDCPTVNLCSSCYHSDKHSTRHSFCRKITPNSPKIAVACRRKAKKILSRGIFPGARVMRGVDWQWEEQDGGLLHKGKVTDVGNWTTTSIRSAVSVVWETNKKNLYRVGFEGRSDLKAIVAGKGGAYYKDHLPMLGERSQRRNSIKFRVGDRVKVAVDMDAAKALQTGHGGWSDGMAEAVDNIGTVVALDEDRDVVIKYSSNNRWTFNPAALKKVSVGEAPPRLSLVLPEDPFTFQPEDPFTYQPGHFVKVSSDLDQVKELQADHGDWVQAMETTLGKVGRVVHIYGDGDLQVEIAGTKWTINPKNVTKLEGDGVPLTPGTSEGVSFMLRQMFETHRASNSVEDLVNAAATGDVGKIEQLLEGGACGVDDKFDGKTALQAAAQNGHIDVVRALTRYNVCLEEADQDGNQAVHHATLGDEPEVIALLAQHDADLNARNRKKQTPLHVAVNKGHVTVIKVLLKEDCHCSLQDLEGDTPLHDAISKKRDDMVQLLVEAQADISATNNNGFNCLHHAALRGNMGAMRLILTHLPPSCSVNEPKDDGFTALHLASLNNHLEVAQTLLAHGGYLDVQNINLQTPLHLAVERKNIQIVRLLVDEGADMDIGDKFGDRPLHEALRYHTMSQLKQLEEANDVGKALVTSNSDKKSSASIAIFLASNGADLQVKNHKDQTPLDLCPDPHLLKLLTKCSLEHHKAGRTTELGTSVNGTPVRIRLKEAVNWSDCSVCLKRQRNMLFVPCGHVITCADCGLTMETCSMCQGEIISKVKIEECLVCSEVNANVLFRPCLHMIACDSCSSRMKKCVKCRVPIEKSIPFSMCCGAKPSKMRRERSGSNQLGSFGGQDDLITLQHQLQEMKDKTQCQVCMDRRKNCVFLCGHGTCQLCADQITECPICRKVVEKKIILFD